MSAAILVAGLPAAWYLVLLRISASTAPALRRAREESRIVGSARRACRHGVRRLLHYGVCSPRPRLPRVLSIPAPFPDWPGAGVWRFGVATTVLWRALRRCCSRSARCSPLRARGAIALSYVGRPLHASIPRGDWRGVWDVEFETSTDCAQGGSPVRTGRRDRLLGRRDTQLRARCCRHGTGAALRRRGEANREGDPNSRAERADVHCAIASSTPPISTRASLAMGSRSGNILDRGRSRIDR